MEIFAAAFAALYAAHHAGDYWVQTDHQARHKGLPGWDGRLNCLVHVLTYLITQVVFLAAMDIVLATPIQPYSWQVFTALAVSGGTHYLADRREHGLLFKLARLLPGKADFLMLGMPRQGVRIETWEDCDTCHGRGTSTDESTGGKCWDCQGGGRLPHWTDDNPQLATGAWSLDQSWHIVLGCFVPALILAA